MKQVKGKFEVKGSPLELDAVAKEIGLMRMRFDKKFEGPLTGTSIVSMMGMMNMETHSGAYIAIEKITGEVESRKGSFCLHHSSSLTQGKPQQSVLVVPDSGTGELTGIEGNMIIDIIGDDHFYTFNYKL
jgi:hypothetical protein